MSLAIPGISAAHQPRSQALPSVMPPLPGVPLRVRPTAASKRFPVLFGLLNRLPKRIRRSARTEARQIVRALDQVKAIAGSNSVAAGTLTRTLDMLLLRLLDEFAPSLPLTPGGTVLDLAGAAIDLRKAARQARPETTTGPPKDEERLDVSPSAPSIVISSSSQPRDSQAHQSSQDPACPRDAFWRGCGRKKTRQKSTWR